MPNTTGSSLGTRLSAKLGFDGVNESGGAIPMETLGKQSFQDKGVTKQEPVVFGSLPAAGEERRRFLVREGRSGLRR